MTLKNDMQFCAYLNHRAPPVQLLKPYRIEQKNTPKMTYHRHNSLALVLGTVTVDQQQSHQMRVGKRRCGRHSLIHQQPILMQNSQKCFQPYRCRVVRPFPLRTVRFFSVLF